MALRGRKAEVKPITRAKILISGVAGCGKTFFSLQFPNVYYIDSEKGAEREQYQTLLQKSNGIYMGREEGASDFGEIIKEFKALSTEKHDCKTVSLDSLSHTYNQAASEAEMVVGNAFGADKKEANKPTRQLLRWIEKIDMNVILICHSKADWANSDREGQPGTTYDAYEKVSYALDLWLELKDKEFIVRKSRIETFPEGLTFNREYKSFSDLFGSDLIDKDVEPIVLAKESEVKNVKKLVQGLNMEESEINKLFKAANVDGFEEMTQKQITSCAGFLKTKVDKLKGDK